MIPCALCLPLGDERRHTHTRLLVGSRTKLRRQPHWKAICSCVASSGKLLLSIINHETFTAAELAGGGLAAAAGSAVGHRSGWQGSRRRGLSNRSTRQRSNDRRAAGEQGNAVVRADPGPGWRGFSGFEAPLARPLVFPCSCQQPSTTTTATMKVQALFGNQGTKASGQTEGGRRLRPSGLPSPWLCTSHTHNPCSSCWRGAGALQARSRAEPRFTLLKRPPPASTAPCFPCSCSRARAPPLRLPPSPLPSPR